jgi:solute carrier family 50 protein (sugar transporter)
MMAFLSPSSGLQIPYSRHFHEKYATLNQKQPYSLKKMVPLRGGALSLSPDAVRLAETLAPKIGIFTSTYLYFAPTVAVLSAIKADDISDLNPLPLAFMSVVSVAWLAYGLSARDKYVALSNIAGCIGSIAYVLGILPLLKNNKRTLRMTQGVILAGYAATLCLWTYLGLSGASAAKISSLLGLFASGFFIILSGSPLSTIKSVFANKNSKSILGALTAAQVVNTSLWSAYGLAVKDAFVWGPNVVGLGLGLVQLLLKIVFPAK